MKSFEKLFKHATGSGRDESGPAPYPFQTRLATGDKFPALLEVPTGSGKTAAIVLSWLYRRRYHIDDAVRAATPRRLVYCLPMRVLVEQTRQEVIRWLFNLDMLAGEAVWDPAPDAQGRLATNAHLVSYDPGSEVPSKDSTGEAIAVHVLMGGEEPTDWSLWPEREAILIGTQDMLLSRALNRGYAASRFRWPMEFGLLNTDSLWIYDEPQLMANGVSTSAQLDAFRRKMSTSRPCPSLWMSATLEPSWLQTVDQDPMPAAFLLSDADRAPGTPLHGRLHARKTLHALAVSSAKDVKKLASAILDHHRARTQTLVVVNTVDRARTLFTALADLLGRMKATTSLLLVHSRFRAHDRAVLVKKLQQPEAHLDRIIVATQVIEAGVDFSATTLVTDLAPWPSLVQRFGRCNRTGADTDGQVFWIDLDLKKEALPYTEEDLAKALRHLVKLEGCDVSPASLVAFKEKERIELPFTHRSVLRRRDLIDLFDTAPDLSGNDIDVGRFIRSDDPDSDVTVFWRDRSQPEWDRAPGRDELCPVPIGKARAFLEALTGRTERAFVWDHLDDAWRPVAQVRHDVRPGGTILLATDAGGYSTRGWDAESREPVTPIDAPPRAEEGTQSDPLTTIPAALTIREHTQHVMTVMNDLSTTLDLDEGHAAVLVQAARWHDVGKAHPVFQRAVLAANRALDASAHWAKSGSRGGLRYERRHFRHELVSALVALGQDEFGGAALPFLSAYLIAAHHGRVRLSIRSLPEETVPDDPETLFALGVHEGDALPVVDLPDVQAPAHAITLEPMRLGGVTSWTARAIALRDTQGPFTLAYLEALLRAADARASREEARHA